ncbi:MAG: type II secretion system F family protein, partial [Mogibacterium sp.]|nr:type II secretion system F family protein [Mogibacterium sp.]
INEYAVRHDVKEMIRIAAILTENERRGSDVVESLERESRYLWEERKTVARECGKAIDTKMSYPLGLLLIVLIVITMAPALMNI